MDSAARAHRLINNEQVARPGRRIVWRRARTSKIHHGLFASFHLSSRVSKMCIAPERILQSCGMNKLNNRDSWAWPKQTEAHCFASFFFLHLFASFRFLFSLRKATTSFYCVLRLLDALLQCARVYRKIRRVSFRRFVSYYYYRFDLLLAGSHGGHCAVGR